MTAEPHTSPQFHDLRAFMAEYGSTKKFLAGKLEISRQTLDGLLLESGTKPPASVFDIRNSLADRIAELIGQTPEYVRNYYAQAVAA